MDMDGDRVGGHRWVDLYRMGGVDIGWVSFCCVVVVARRDRVRRSVGGHAGQASQDAGSYGHPLANAYIIPCPLSTPPMPRPQTAATSVRSLSVVVALNK